MDPMEAMEMTRDPDEQENLADDHLIHRDEDYPDGVEHDGEVEPVEQPPPAEEGALTTDIEKGTKPKKPRSKAQQEAFAKARKALAEKRAKAKEGKAQNKKPRGRPRAEKPKKEKKPPRVVFQVPDEVSSESSEEEVVYVQRKKPKAKKKKAPKQPRIVYVTDSDEEEDEPYQPQQYAPPAQMTDYYHFV